jgi:hypothetical protein
MAENRGRKTLYARKLNHVLLFDWFYWVFRIATVLDADSWFVPRSTTEQVPNHQKVSQPAINLVGKVTTDSCRVGARPGSGPNPRAASSSSSS